MNPSDPYGETRASARAAALSDPMSSRCSRSPVRHRVAGAEIGRRCGADIGPLDDDRHVEIRRAFSRNTTAVMTLVMLAIERCSFEFDSQSTLPVAGL